MEIEILKKAGLTDSQAKGYLALVDNGPLSPSDIAKISNETRTNGYAIADKLIKLKLAHKSANGSLIEADSPTRLRSILNARQIRLKTINDELNSILPVMLSKFKLSSDQPGVLSIEGVDSLKIIYDEIIQTNKDVLIMSSPHDRDDPEISAMLDEQITRQRAAGIKTFALVQESIYDAIVKSTDDLFEVKKLPDGTSFDAQIIICGDTVISTVYNQGVSSSIIVSPETANTLRSVFYLIWNRS